MLIPRREELQDQHALSTEIGNAITSVPIGEQPDEEDLDAELEGLEQEAMDAKMVNTGFVPVGTQLDRLPAAGNTDREFELPFSYLVPPRPSNSCSTVKQPAKAEDDEEAELEKLRAEMAM